MRGESCIYYNGTRGDQPICERGIDVRSKFKPLWPCFTGNKPSKSSARCEHFEPPTAEQLLDQEREGDAAVERMLISLGEISMWEDAQPKPHKYPLRGAIACPCCQKPLQILIDANHMYAQCATAKCVNFRGNRRGCRR